MSKKSILFFFIYYTITISSGFKEIVPLENPENFIISKESTKQEIKTKKIKSEKLENENLENIVHVKDKEEVKETIEKNSVPIITETQLKEIIANSNKAPSLSNQVELERKDFHSINLDEDSNQSDFFKELEETLNRYKFSDKSENKYAGRVTSKELTSDKIIDNLEFGVGIAYKNTEYYDSQYEDQNSDIWTHTPIYATGKYKISSNEESSKYLKLNLGYAIREYDNSEKYEEIENRNGIYYGVGGGVEFKNISLDLMYQVNKEAYIKNNSPEDDSRITFSVDYKLDF